MRKLFFNSYIETVANSIDNVHPFVLNTEFYEF